MLKLVSIDALDTTLVSLDEAKNQPFVTQSDSDTFITSLISVSRQHAENYTRRTLIPTTYTLYLDRFPGGDEIIMIRQPPIIIVASVKYYDSSGTLQTISTDDYQVDLNSEPARLRPEESWPITDDRMNAVEIAYSAGYDASSAFYTIPKVIKQAILTMLAHCFNNREAVVISEGRAIDVKEIPLTFKHLLDPYKIVEFF